MAKLYFKYGAMGSSKTAQALMCRFNYMQKGYSVLLLKSSYDNRFENGKDKIISRIGLEADCVKFSNKENLIKLYNKYNKLQKIDVIIVDEAQFATTEQIDQLKEISGEIPVLCYGLLTNFKTQLFEGSKRLVEIADSLSEIKSVCKCGRKATVNARFIDGKITTDGAEIQIGAEEIYQGMCFWCFKKELNKKGE